ncbi:MAG: prenyltransferase [Candidatus Omnitrophota bacterium]
MVKIKYFVRALRLPFVTASILPFIFGSLIQRANFNSLNFLFGIIAVTFTHLSANLINDYADSKSGVDWQDKNFYKFFGGSKLIQENKLSENFYLKSAIFFAILAFLSTIFLSLNLKAICPIIFYLFILFLAWFYSKKPFSFSYHKLGEFIIFILFGPALVMGGYFIQTKIFPDLKSFILSLPLGFLTTAILFVNEIPDFSEDIKTNKLTWVSIVGSDKAYLIYVALISLAYLAIVFNIFLKYLNIIAINSFIFIILTVKATWVLKTYPKDKIKLIESSKLTIMLQILISLILIIGIIL